MEHTEAPWDYRFTESFRDPTTDDIEIIQSKTGECLARYAGNRHRSTANARLIAAAPELLEALEKAVADYGKEGGPWNVPSEPGSWIEMARAAIAKAKGE